jgi:hypothetical protein
MIDALAKVLVAGGLEPEVFTSSGADEAFFRATLPTAKIAQSLDALWRGSRETKYLPVIRGAADEIHEQPRGDVAAILAEVQEGRIREILAPRFEERRESWREMMPEVAGIVDMDELARWVDASGIYSFGGRENVAQPWPADKAKPQRFGFHTLKQLKGKPAVMLLVRLEHSYEIPAYLGFGGWNDCPGPAVQVAMLREWRKEYGAVAVCVTGDVLECVVPRSPQTEEAAMKLAAEQWIFCEDIVGQGTQSVRALAMEIWKSPTWFFWWD